MSANPQRRFRKKLDDRLIHAGAERTRAQIEIDYALGPVDHKIREMDRKWGVDRLPDLVEPDTAKRYGSAVAKLEAARDAEDPDEVLARAKVVLRGLEYMDAEAERLGRAHARGDVWEYELDGYKFGILADGAEWPAAQDERPDLRLFTLREIAVALRTIAAHHPMIERAKQIGGAEIVSIKPKLDNAFWKEGGDDIPF